MKFIIAVALCLLGTTFILAQPEKPGNSFAEKSAVKAVTLGREDSDGNIEVDVETFNTTDVPIYCYVDLTSGKPTTVKLVFVAVKVKGIRPNSKLLTTSYKTKEGEDAVTFTGRPAKTWTVGKYRVDIFINGEKKSSKEFSVEAKKLSRSAVTY